MGVAMSMYDSNYPPKAKWSTKDIPDLSGKIAIVTGGNSGIGKETAKALLQKKAKVYIASRDARRCQEAISDLKAQTGFEALYISLDLADLESVRSAAADFQSKEAELHILVNNAGVMFSDVKDVTKQGYDLQFGINVIGHFLFTNLLLPQLIAAKSSRVVTLSSHGHILTKSINWDTIKDGPARRKMSSFDLYCQSKFANVVFASELARLYADKGIISTSVHPGLIVTNLGRNVAKPAMKVMNLLAYSADKGALTSLFAATAEQTSNANGKYFLPWARFGEPHPATLNPETGTKLWEWLEKETATA